MQRAGDKSGELSVKTESSFRTQDLLEEASQDSESEDEEDIAEDTDDDGGEISDDDNDDDLSEQMSYDDNDNSAYNNASSLGPFTDDDDDNPEDDELLFDGGDGVERAGIGEAVADSEDDAVSEDEDGDEPGLEMEANGEDDDRSAPQDYAENPIAIAESTLEDLIKRYNARSQVSSDQYKRSMRLLHSKWSSIMESVLFQHEEQLDRADQERQDMEMHIEEIREQHLDELESAKIAVMEQSQKIILEEMKANADREIKSEETTEIAVQKAVEETKKEMNEDFEIALAGMKSTQEEMKARYEKLIKDTEVRVKDEVEVDIKKRYMTKLASFKSQFGEMKKEVVEKTMRIQELEMKSESSKETEDLIASQENEISVLRTSLEDMKKEHTEEVERLKLQMQSDTEGKDAKNEEATEVAVQKAVEDTKKEMNEDFEIALAGMKSTQEEMKARYEKLIKDTEVRVKDEVEVDIKKRYMTKLASFKSQFGEMKKEVVEKTMRIQELEMKSESSKETEDLIASQENEISVLRKSLEDTKRDHQSLLDKQNDEKEAINAEALEVAVQKAETETKQKLEEEYEAKLADMKIAQDELSANHGKLIKEIEMKSESSKEMEDLIASQENEISILRKSLKEAINAEALEAAVQKAETETKQKLEEEFEAKLADMKIAQDELSANHGKLIKEIEMKSESSKEMEDLIASQVNEISVLRKSLKEAINAEALEAAVQKAETETKQKLEEEFEAKLADMKIAQDELSANHGKLIKETEARVHKEAYAKAKKEFASKIEPQSKQFEKIQQTMVEMATELDKLELENQAKDEEIENLNADLEAKSAQLESLGADMNKTIQELGDNLQAKSDLLKQLTDKAKKHDDDLASKDRLIRNLQDEIEKKQNLVQLYDIELSSKIQELVAEITGRDERIEILEGELEEKISAMKKLRSSIDKGKVADNGIDKIKAELDETNNIIQELGSEMEVKNKEIEQLQGQLGVQSLAKEEVDAKLNQHMSKVDELSGIICEKDQRIGVLESEVESNRDQAKSFESEMESRNIKLKMLSTELDSKENEIKRLGDLIDERDKRLSLEMGGLQEMTAKHENETQQLINVHKTEVAKLEMTIREKNEILKTRESEHKKELHDVKTQAETEIMKKHMEEIRNLKEREEEKAGSAEHLYEDQVKYLQDKYDETIEHLKKQLEDEKLYATARIDDMVEEHNNDIASSEARFNESLSILKRNHNFELKELANAALSEKQVLDGAIKEMEMKEKAHQFAVKDLKDTIEAMKRDHQIAIERLEVEHNRESAESLRLIDQLRVEKDNLMAAAKSVSSNKSSSSSKLSIKRKNISPGAPKGKKVIEGPPISSQMENIASKDGEDNRLESPKAAGEAASVASAGKTTVTSRSMASRGVDTVGSPDKKQPNQVLLDLSPLTMTSPIAMSTKSMARAAGRKPGRVPQTVDTKLNAQYKTPDGRKSSRASTSPANASSGKGSSRVGRSSAPRSESSDGSARRSSKSRTPRTSNSVPRTPKLSTSDMGSAQRKSRQGLFSNYAPTPLVHSTYTDVRLMVLNVPITDRRRRMAKALRIQFTDDPLDATHVIAGDVEHHIRRTAKFMAVLCVTPNIVKAEWLDESYKAKDILGCNRYLLINDRKAEEAYSFSMRNTIREANDRRNEGGLLYGWKILICKGVAGNKAPKEADLRMMIYAAGGQWIDSSQIPIPIGEDPTHAIVITSDPPTTLQTNDESAHVAAESGAGFYTISWLFDCMMHQKLLGIKRGLGRI